MFCKDKNFSEKRQWYLTIINKQRANNIVFLGLCSFITKINITFALKYRTIMDKENLRKLFKFYSGEEDNPFIGKDNFSAKWWEGEKCLLMLVENDKETWNRIANLLKKAIKENAVTTHLVDEKIDFDQRVIYFYLDLWNGKNFPYDSLDDIFGYVATKKKA